jgi:transposase
MEFMKNIQSHILPEYAHKRLILVLDNHRSHYGLLKASILNEFCETHFIPTYSCALNGPIETCWSVVKKRVLPKFSKLQLRLTSSREACIAVLKKELRSMDPSTFANLLRSHYCYLT